MYSPGTLTNGTVIIKLRDLKNCSVREAMLLLCCQMARPEAAQLDEARGPDTR